MRAVLGWIAVPALLAAGCGGGGSGDEPGRDGSPATRQGGEVRVLSGGDIDFADPGQTYYTFGYQIQYAVNRPLYSFAPGDEDVPRPDLAQDDPIVSEDQRTVTVKLKAGIRYAPPVGREVTAMDVKYAIERAFSARVPSGYAHTYFGDVAGAPAAPAKGIPDIEGIETPDARTLVLRLERPIATTVAAALVMPITIPVPEEYARRFDARSASTYDQHVAFTGPYMIRNDERGRLVGRDPGRRIELVRNPNWERATDFRPAHLDQIVVEAGNDDLIVASRRTLAGERMMCCDVAPPPAVLSSALERRRGQVARAPAGATFWVALNTREPPFNDLDVRRAVLAGFDREALLLARGGAATGTLAQHFIPPGNPGHEESGGEAGFAGIDFMADPKGDRELAARYFRAAGHASGRYEGDARVLSIGASTEPDTQVAAIAQQQLTELGFDVDQRNLAPDTVFTKFCGVPSSHYVVCPNVGWARDIADARSLLDPPFNGAAIVPQGNVNWSQLADPEIDAAMREAAVLPAGAERDRAWAEINRMVVEEAVAIPYSWPLAIQLASSDVVGAMNPYTTQWDLAFSALRRGG